MWEVAWRLKETEGRALHYIFLELVIAVYGVSFIFILLHFKKLRILKYALW
jgi:uncharacterized protein YybS (DUF2232 family)